MTFTDVKLNGQAPTLQTVPKRKKCAVSTHVDRDGVLAERLFLPAFVVRAPVPLLPGLIAYSRHLGKTSRNTLFTILTGALTFRIGSGFWQQLFLDNRLLN